MCDKGLCLSRKRGVFALLPRALVRTSRSGLLSPLHPINPLILCAPSTLGFLLSQQHPKCDSATLLAAPVFLQIFPLMLQVSIQKPPFSGGLPWLKQSVLKIKKHHFFPIAFLHFLNVFTCWERQCARALSIQVSRHQQALGSGSLAWGQRKGTHLYVAH